MRLCSDRHISVVADTVIRYLPSAEVIKYIMQSGIGDMRDKTFPMAVGACLQKANVACLRANGRYEFDENSYVYVETTRLFSIFDLIKAKVEFCASCGFRNDFNIMPIIPTYALLCSVHKTLRRNIHDIPLDAFNIEYEKAFSWLDD